MQIEKQMYNVLNSILSGQNELWIFEASPVTNKNYVKFRKICITILLKSNTIKIDSADITSGDVVLEKKDIWSYKLNCDLPQFMLKS